jgi:adenylate cyclase class 1
MGLPGYTSSKTPTGISHYHPDKETLALAKSYQKDFTYRTDKEQSHSLQGVYLMGSVSSLAFSEHSDIDIWLCHKNPLSSHEKSLLQDKANAVKNWAASLNLEVHIFLVDSRTFLKGKKTPLSAESSGEMQHYLLLEEFYRTAIYIAGRTPIWWLIPPEEEQNYTLYLKHLIKSELINPNDFIDFGGLEDIPADEFIGSTLWHLYKSLLKLLLMECYESEYPKPQWISLELKKAIYQGNYQLDALDPYVLIYNKIDPYLQQSNNTERLNYARQCFYLKIMGDMEANPQQQKLQDRLTLLKEISQNYHWDKNLLKALRKNSAWDIKKASLENDHIIQQLKQYYLMVSRFAETNSLSSKNQDIQLIGQKLKSFLQKKPGKIDIITTRASIRCKSNELNPPLLEIALYGAYTPVL